MKNLDRDRARRAAGDRAVSDAIFKSAREDMLRKTHVAAAAFEQRWTMNALQDTDPDLYQALIEQRELFHEALVTGSDEEIIEHGEAMCRGWKAASATMEHSKIANDAVHVGIFGDVIVAIGRSQQAPPHLIEKYGDRLTYLRPREVAAMYTHYRHAQSVKAIWPDAEITEIREKADVWSEIPR